MSTATAHSAMTQSVRVPSSAMTQSVRVPSKSSISPEVELVRQAFLACYVCKEQFSDNDHIPRILPCLHCVCEDCLETIKSRDSVVCPECKESHSILNGDVKTFQRDGSREYLTKYMKVQTNETAISCDECTDKRQGTHRCKECSQFLCSDCTDAHMKTKVTKKHELNELKECTIEEFQAVQHCTVKGHEDHTFTYYCVSDTCDKPVCALCAVQFHTDSKCHKLRTLTDVYAETKRTIDNMLSEVKHKQLTTDDTLNIVEDTITSLDGVQEKLTEDIDATFSQYQKKLDEKKEDVKNELLNIVSIKKQRLQDQLNALNVHKGNLDDSNEFVTCASTYASPTEFMYLKDQIIERLEDLNSRHFDTNPRDNADVQFKKENMDKDFKLFSESVGKILSYDVTMNDILADVEDIPITIHLYNVKGAPRVEGGFGIKVEIKDPDGKIHRPVVEDHTNKQGCYKVNFMSPKLGRHYATVLVNGESINANGYKFNVIPHGTGRQSVTYNVTIVGQPPRDVMHGDVNCVDLSFDASVAHANIDISPDGKLMKMKTMHQRNDINFREPVSRVRRFKYYKGTIASKSFSKAGLVYWEVVVQYKVLHPIYQTMLFEMGLTRFEYVDKHYTVDRHPYAWAISARGCDTCGKICLQTWHNGQLMTHSPLSNRTATTSSNGVNQHYGFLLDSNKRHWIIVNLKTKKVIFHFKNLVVSDMSDPLFPVFAIYNPEQVRVSMELLSGMSIESVPQEVLDALVVT